MSVFNEYARYYDLLYRDKNYRGEADYIHKLIREHRPGARTILNLGCGSGRHDQYLEELGYAITGVDLSEEMLSAAQNASINNNKREYIHGDIRSVRLDKTYDVVLSLFHVVSYLVTNNDLKSAFLTAKAHLKPEGLFIFDCWYGPGVLTDPPTLRVKELEDETISVTRIATPILYPNDNTVDVDYRISIRNKHDGEAKTLQETHRMRYLFIPEIVEYLSYAGLSPLFFSRWMETAPPNDTTWNLCVGAKR
ncbi:MAG: class I SAM-dependent methyltransferase [Geobacteraceae bacterium]|nr:class I SAM-dependent methyltransferase [Geobacteraceae bacterium]